jgi:hypothetical protein
VPVSQVEISKPSLLEIKGILDFWNGKGMSGGLVSTADFSPRSWESVEGSINRRNAREFTLFIYCHWVMRDKSNIGITDEMQHIEEWAMRAQEFFNEKIISKFILFFLKPNQTKAFCVSKFK